MNVLALGTRRLLPMLVALGVSAFALSLVPSPLLAPGWVFAAIALLALAWALVQPLDTERDDYLPPLAVALGGLGLAVVARIAPQLAQRQAIWAIVALALVVVLAPQLARFRQLASFKYLWIVASFLLFLGLLVFGREVNGAKLWIQAGPLQFEPVEVIKLFIVFFLAAYLAETADVIAAAPPWSLRANAKYLGPLFLGWGASMAILVLQRDLGMAALLLFVFATMLYVATRRIDIVLVGLVIFGLVAWFAMHHFAYVHTRVGTWLNPFADPLGKGFQASQAYYALAAGGLFGSGFGLGTPTLIPDVSTDYVYVAIAEEFGWIGAMLVIATYFALVRRAIGVAREQPDLYAKLLATGLAATLGFQVFVIVGGNIGLFPLTGITLPFVSYGGSSLVANAVLIALLWAISSRPRCASGAG